MARRPRNCEVVEETQAAATGWANRVTDDELADAILDAVAAVAKLDAELAGAEAEQVARVGPMLDRLRGAVARLPAGRDRKPTGFRP